MGAWPTVWSSYVKLLTPSFLIFLWKENPLKELTNTKLTTKERESRIIQRGLETSSNLEEQLEIK